MKNPREGDYRLAPYESEGRPVVECHCPNCGMTFYRRIPYVRSRKVVTCFTFPCPHCGMEFSYAPYTEPRR